MRSAGATRPPVLPLGFWRSAPASPTGSCRPRYRGAPVASRGSRPSNTLARCSVSLRPHRVARRRLGSRTVQATACGLLACARAPRWRRFLLPCALTVRPSRRRFAARLNSSVRPHGLPDQWSSSHRGGSRAPALFCTGSRLRPDGVAAAGHRGFLAPDSVSRGFFAGRPVLVGSRAVALGRSRLPIAVAPRYSAA